MSLSISNCPNPKCDNKINTTSHKIKGGLNDVATIYFRCNICGNEDGFTVVHNPESVSISGGTKIKTIYKED